MMLERFSPFVLKALADTISGGSANDPTPSVGYYRSGPTIEQFFLDCGIMMRVGSSSRVPATLEALRDAAARQDGDEVFKRLILRVCDPREYLQHPEKAEAVREHINRALEPDGFAVAVVNGRVQLTVRETAGLIVTPFLEKATVLDFDTVQADIGRALASADTDPEDAVTAACSIIESVCRSILIELALELPPKKDLSGLVGSVQVALDLSPGRSGLPSEVEADVRQILGGLTSVAKGVGALRTHAGDAHGREKGFRRIDARIARLAINASSTIALLFIETWERKQRRSLPNREVA